MKIDNIIECKYVTLFGLILACNKREIIKITDDAGYLCEEMNITKLNTIQDNDVIYIKSNMIADFIDNVLPKIDKKIILVTANDDASIPVDLLSYDTFVNTINNDKILHWFSQNCIESLHPKLTVIPLGVNFHCCAYEQSGNRMHWKVEHPLSPIEQEEIIINILNSSKPFYKRNVKCYSSFNLTIWRKFDSQRLIAIQQIPKELIDYQEKQISRKDTWTKQSEYAFVVSPMGNGFDCHRTWEALILGCIVIVKKSPIDSLFDELPVLIVNEWSDITQDLLTETVDKFKNMTFNYDKITLKYWIDKIYLKVT
jgi:hypothetical protein